MSKTNKTPLILASVILAPMAILMAGERGGDPVYTSLTVYSSELSPLPGIQVQLNPQGQEPILGCTGELGTTEFYALDNGSHVDYSLHETPINGGLAVGIQSDFSIAATGEGHLAFAKQLTQPFAHTMLINDNGAEESTFYPENRTYPFWDINVPAKSGVNFTADIGVLVNKAVIADALDYYGYAGDSPWQRGLFMRVNTPGGAKLGVMGVGLVMHNYGELDYGSMQLDILHFSPDGDDPTYMHVSEKPLDSLGEAPGPHEQTLYYIGDRIPEGYLFFLWGGTKTSDKANTFGYALNTPAFNGSQNQGIDIVDLTGEGAEAATMCNDCTPPLPAADPSWTCTPGAVSGWTSFWNFGCPGDGTAVGTPTCSQWGAPVTPIFCDTNGNITLTVTVSTTISVTLEITGGELGGEVTIEQSTAVTANIEPGENGCGQCVRLWGVGLICAQKWANKDDKTCNTGGYCFGSTWTKPCYTDNPIYTHCVDSKVTTTRCNRTKQ